MLSAQLFETDEQQFLGELYTRAILVSHPDRTPQASGAERNTDVLVKIRKELINARIITARTLREISLASPLGAITVANDVIPLDRGCKPYALDSLRNALIDISEAIAKALATDSPRFDAMRAKVLEHKDAAYAQMIDYLYALNWIGELLAPETRAISKETVRLSGDVTLRDVMRDAFNLVPHYTSGVTYGEPWEVTEAKNALKAVEMLIQKDALKMNPYSSRGDFQFPYTDIDQVLDELGYSETEIARLRSTHELFKHRSDNISDQEIIWILLNFSTDSWFSTNCSLSIVKRDKEKDHIGDELFDHVINHGNGPLYYSIDLYRMREAQGKVAKLSSPLDATTDLTLTIHDMTLVTTTFDADSTSDARILNPEHYQKYFRPFLRYTRQQHAIADRKVTANRLLDSGDPAPDPVRGKDQQLAVASTKETSLIMHAETSVERELIDEIQADIVSINQINPNFLNEHFIPDNAAELVTLVKVYAADMMLFTALRDLSQWFAKLKGYLIIISNTAASDYAKQSNTAQDGIINMVQAILTRIFPDKKIIIGWELKDKEAQLETRLIGIIRDDAHFFQKHGLPQTSADYQATLKVKYGLDYGAQLDRIVGLVGNIQSFLEPLRTSPGSESLQRFIGDDAKTIKEIVS